MGLHTGEPTIRDGAYYGLDVHQAARIAQAGSGGQVLLSQRTRDALESSHEVADLGEHELAGLDEPVRLFQLNIPGLPLAFHRSARRGRGFAVCA
jgi:class 3 adenylate cyclase